MNDTKQLPESGLQDSGDRTVFQTGAMRDRGGEKSRPDLISPFFEDRLGELLRKGAIKYSAWNWAKGMPNREYWASLRRHIMKAEMGMTDEDHFAAAAFNLMALMHNQELIKRGLLPKEFDDFPVNWGELSTQPKP